MIPIVFVRSDGNYDMDAASLESGLRCDDPSMAQQSGAEEADINTIVRRFGLTGHLPVNVSPPFYADFEDAFDFNSSMNAIAKANEAFDAMPAEVRARFANDPQRFVEFVNDDKNLDEAVRMGLAMPRAKVEAAAAAKHELELAQLKATDTPAAPPPAAGGATVTSG